METICFRNMCNVDEFDKEKAFFEVLKSFVRVHVPYDTFIKQERKRQ